MNIAPNSFWRYRGPGNGRGEIHKIIFLSREEIVTVAGARSWLGPLELFQQHFAPATL